MNTIEYVISHRDEIKESLMKRRSDYPLAQLLKLATMRNSMRPKENDKELQKLDSKINDLLLKLPNILDRGVPVGNTEEDYKVLKRSGTISKISGSTHSDILSKLGLLDFKRGEKISSGRFYYLFADLARLEQSLIRFATDLLVGKGYTQLSPPLLLSNRHHHMLSDARDLRDSIYSVNNNEHDLSLLTTSEHAIAAMHAGERMDARKLPLKYVAGTPCFRREADKASKDLNSLMRVNQFYKVEQFIFTDGSESRRRFDELLSNAEEIYAKLELPYEVVACSSVDIGISASKKIDIGVYMPGEGKYREMVSCSDCTEWQSSRLDIKYVRNGRERYVHTMNCTALATTRTLAAIAENYVDKDGVINVPRVLVPYFGKRQLGDKSSGIV